MWTGQIKCLLFRVLAFIHSFTLFFITLVTSGVGVNFLLKEKDTYFTVIFLHTRIYISELS